MVRRCVITQKGVMSGRSISITRSQVSGRSKRRFLPNLQLGALYSEILGFAMKLRMSSKGLRTVEKKGGLDSYLLETRPSKLSPTCKKLRAQVEKAKKSKGL